LCLGGTIIELMENPAFSLRKKEESIQVQNGSALHEETPPSQNDVTHHDDRETLLNAGNMQPSVEYLPRKKSMYSFII